ncbi:glutamate racemase [Candidatus Peribacteria bacterium]|nr:glutamate racemase [Candidatus Peribacteria bacterium]
MRRLGVFDSGVGGLTLLRALQQVMPACPFLYLADTAALPYGEKSPAEIIHRTELVTQYLEHAGCSIIVYACNTACTVAHQTVQAQGEVPHFEIISPLREQLLLSRARPLGVLCTRATAESGVFQQLGEERGSPYRVLACPDLVPLIEGNAPLEQLQRAVKRYCRELCTGFLPEIVVLGCTHYEALRGLFQQYLPPCTHIISQPALLTVAFQRYVRNHEVLIDTIDTTPRTEYCCTAPVEVPQAFTPYISPSTPWHGISL